MTRSRRLALIGFLGHAPGLWLVAGHRLDGATARLNVAAALATLAAMAGGYALHRGLGLFIAWVVGHFIWSTVLAVRLGRADCSSAAAAEPSPPRGD